MENRTKSMIEEMICDRSFAYLRPYFYCHPYALRCELGRGDTEREWFANARRRAKEIGDLLLKDGADAILFNCWYGDIDAAALTEQARFRDRFLNSRRHLVLENMPVYEDSEGVRRDRVICFSDGEGFDLPELIERQISGAGEHEISFVSFQNECILSIYDDRGCDAVFAIREAMRAFYPQLEPYFLDHDRSEMQRRYG